MNSHDRKPIKPRAQAAPAVGGADRAFGSNQEESSSTVASSEWLIETSSSEFSSKRE